MSERHSGHLSKAAAKQMRTVDLDFNYTRPGTNSQVGRRRGRDFEESIPSHGVGISVVPTSLVDQNDGLTNSQVSEKAAPIMTTENFPSLGGKNTIGNSNGGMLFYILSVLGSLILISSCGIFFNFPSLNNQVCKVILLNVLPSSQAEL